MAARPPAAISSGPRPGDALGGPRGQGFAPYVVCPLGDEQEREPSVGQLGGHLDVLRSHRRHPDGDLLAYGVVDELQRLAQTGSEARWQGDGVQAVIRHHLPAPHLPTDADDLAGALERLGVGHAVPPLDDLWARRPQSEDEPALAQGVDAGRGLGQERRRAGVDGQDGRADLDPLGLRRDVSHLTGPVEAVGLGHPHDVEAGAFEFGDVVGGLLDPSRVVEHRAQPHRDSSLRVAPDLVGRIGHRPTSLLPPHRGDAAVDRDHRTCQVGTGPRRQEDGGSRPCRRADRCA